MDGRKEERNKERKKENEMITVCRRNVCDDVQRSVNTLASNISPACRPGIRLTGCGPGLLQLSLTASDDVPLRKYINVWPRVVAEGGGQVDCDITVSSLW